MRELFIKYNTPIPSSAAVERMFSMGKDVLRPKRSRMTDKHFEMLVLYSVILVADANLTVSQYLAASLLVTNTDHLSLQYQGDYELLIVDKPPD
ncbi:hypothetical protein Hamer_G010183 [Homarus americanus]|uniref:HAT C-terminal dimerisation domain-containing protein n=1 Tax=Homarus americanus TaxID=6706 RepID=A0A8J5K716_HOMAM|nr:hypothetical protein Hamer_G010183 [Homarus americanus]